MKWTPPIKDKHSRDYFFAARKDGYKATVEYSDCFKYFFFIVDNGKKYFNSLYENRAFRSSEDCKAACEKWIDENGK